VAGICRDWRITAADYGKNLAASSHLEQIATLGRTNLFKYNKGAKLADLCKIDRIWRTIGAARGKAARGAPLAPACSTVFSNLHMRAFGNDHTIPLGRPVP
jgi:hypothetical protein